MRPTSLLASLAFCASVLAAPCPDPVDMRTVETTAVDVEFGGSDVDRRGRVVCVAEVTTPSRWFVQLRARTRRRGSRVVQVGRLRAPRNGTGGRVRAVWSGDELVAFRLVLRGGRQSGDVAPEFGLGRVRGRWRGVWRLADVTGTSVVPVSSE